MVLRRSSADCGASAPARTASSSARTSCLFTYRGLRVIRNCQWIVNGLLRLLAPGLQGDVDDLFERDTMLERTGVAVFVLGLCVGDDAVQRGGLDADFAIRRDDCRGRAIECGALLG